MTDGYTLSTSDGQSAPDDDARPAGAPDPGADYWTIADVAAYWGVAPQTIRAYRSRGRGELPEPDRVFSRSPAWKPATIIGFSRLGQGYRSDLL